MTGPPDFKTAEAPSFVADRDAPVGAVTSSSRDEGATWDPVVLPQPCRGDTTTIDSDVRVGPDGILYVAVNMFPASVTIATSRDEGRTWMCPPTPLGAGSYADRPWLAVDADQPGVAYVAVSSQDAAGIATTVPSDQPTRDQERVWRTSDGGATWTERAAIPGLQDGIAALFVAQGSLIATRYDRDQILVFRSVDAAATWTTQTVARDHALVAGYYSPVAFTTRDGALYLAWLEQGESSSRLAMISSSDAGRTWPAHTTLIFDEPGNATFLWGVGGSKGRLGFAWYSTPKPGRPVFVEAAIVTGADTIEPRVEVARVGDAPASARPPCEDGTLCFVEQRSRWAGDLLSCAIDPRGRLLVASTDETGGEFATVAIETLGPSLFDGAAPGPWVS